MHGNNRIGYTLSATNKDTLTAINPSNGKELPGKFHIASDTEVNLVMEKAQEAFEVYSGFSAERKANFLETIAEEILGLGDTLIQRVCAETALPEARVIGERGRTVNQLKMFAQYLRDGSWVEAIIDTAQPDRKPLPKPDLRKMLVPVGPVVVFTASNFPLAFSTAGGDTASALAAGNPVIVKAHGSHLGTNELVADAIATAANKTGMPDGVFSTVQGGGSLIGQQLAKHSITKSIAFTGSHSGGMALHKTALQREEPIPVFAEMGSINPVLFLPEKLEKEYEELANVYAGSITLGTGQFCTNPGLLIMKEGEALDQFIEQISGKIAEIAPSTMLNSGISENYWQSKAKTLKQQGVQLISQSTSKEFTNEGAPAIATVSAKDFIHNSLLQAEVFGPFSLIVRCADDKELTSVIRQLKGQLTATVMATESDVNAHTQQIDLLTNAVGRLIFNGVPTGVEVTHAMNHGGPYPASTDARFTSVGTDAIKRFVRPVSYQNAPQSYLPKALQDSNPLGIWRKVNGKLTTAPVAHEMPVTN